MSDEMIITGLRALTVPAQQTLQERVYDELRRALMQGLFPPGSLLHLTKVAEAMGTSVMPVREALRQLTAERAIRALPNRGFGIPEITRKVLDDLCDTRMLIEGAAAEMAAILNGPSLVDELIRINEQISAAVVARDRTTYRSANQRFHFMIYEASGSEIMLHVIETLWLQAGPYLNLMFPDSDPQPIVQQDRHLDAIEAMRCQDGAMAKRAIAADIGEAADRVRRKLA